MREILHCLSTLKLKTTRDSNLAERKGSKDIVKGFQIFIDHQNGERERYSYQGKKTGCGS